MYSACPVTLWLEMSLLKITSFWPLILLGHHLLYIFMKMYGIKWCTSRNINWLFDNFDILKCKMSGKKNKMGWPRCRRCRLVYGMSHTETHYIHPCVEGLMGAMWLRNITGTSSKTTQLQCHTMNYIFLVLSLWGCNTYLSNAAGSWVGTGPNFNIFLS